MFKYCSLFWENNELKIFVTACNIDNIKCSTKYKRENISYPPKNTILINIHIRTILAYSAKKKNTNIPAECSVINPDTNSDSASAKSKGALFVSAIHPIKKIINKGNNGNKKYVIFCASMLIVKLRLLV